jgi:hypothetical protein
MTAPTGQRGSTSSCSQGLFTMATDVALETAKEPWLMRRRPVRIDRTPLDGTPNALALNLFDDVCLTAVRDSGTPSEDGIWVGTIEGVPASRVTLVTRSGVMIGTIVSPPDSFQIRLLRDDVYVVTQVDPSKYPKEKLGQ